MELSVQSKAKKISRTEVELSLREGHKSYILMQVELSSAPRKDTNFSCMLDDWVEAINQVVGHLQKAQQK